MAASVRPSTLPPPSPPRDRAKAADITPEQVRRMEESRLKAKALQAQQDAASARLPSSKSRGSYPIITGEKRSYTAMSSATSTTNRDARTPPAPRSNNGMAQAQDLGIRAARKFQKYVEYDFSRMTDTKGGFMTHEDDPFNKALHAPEADGKPARITLKEWERMQFQRRLQQQRSGPYEPGISALSNTEKKCRECGSLEIDWEWDEVLRCQVCHTCKDKFDAKYSLLTKTEVKEDYLLTDPELRDETLLPRLEKPNPHKSTWNNMMLFLRYQVEDYAFSDKKWGSQEALDEEWVRRQNEAKVRKERKFRDKLQELKKRTRIDAYKRSKGGGGGDFGDVIGNGRHEHVWSRAVEDAETGDMKKSCQECGMEVPELVFD